MRYAVKDAKAWVRESLSGYFVCPTTPFRDDLSLDEDGMRRNVEHLLGLESTNGLYVNSVLAEYMGLTLAERKRCAEIAVETAAGRVPIVVEVTTECLPDSIELANHARDHGVDLVMLGSPLTGLRTRRGVLDFFRRFAAETEIGISVFSTSWPDIGFHIDAGMLLELSELDAVCLVKDAGTNLQGFYEMVTQVGPRMVVSRPSIHYWLAGRHVLGPELMPRLFMGTISPIYCDGLTRAFDDAVRAEDWPRATDAMMRVQRLTAALADTHAAGHHAVAFLKAVSGLFGMATGPVRPPIEYPSEAALEKARRTLEAAGALPVPASV